ncbi:type II toxin-antitoxin system HigB family toxin [soil metagenome]
MNTISYRKIREFVTANPNSEPLLTAWYKIAKKATWQNIVELRMDYPHADLVGGLVVFNISGNNYRLIEEIHFESQLVLIRHIFTHADYDKDKWK